MKIEEADYKILKRTRERLTNKMKEAMLNIHNPTEKDIFICELIDYIDDLEAVIFGLWVDRIRFGDKK